MRADIGPDDLDVVEEWNIEDAQDLELPADTKNYAITVSSRDWTVATIVSQVEQGNIDLDPAFQRRNAWRDPRRSRLIESFILGFPVPQLVLAESPRRRGTFIVIDGKQRLMTIAGLFLDSYRGYWTLPRFSGLSVLKDLNRVELDDFTKSAQYSAELRRLANADIRTTVVTGFRNEGVLYDIFYRINTGSVPLSTQELRQALNRGSFSEFLLGITGSQNPLWEVLRIESPDPRLRDAELLLRLIALNLFSRRYSGNMKQFLDNSMSQLNAQWDRARAQVEDLVGQIFRAVEAARRVFGDDTGRRFKDGQYERQLNRALFEVQAYYLSHPEIRRAAVRRRTAILQASQDLFRDADFVASIESTTKSLENYKIRFSAYRQMLERTLDLRVEPLQLP